MKPFDLSEFKKFLEMTDPLHMIDFEK